MSSAQVFTQALDLLGGELRDSSGHRLTIAARPIVEVHGTAQARAALAQGRRAAIAVPVSSTGALSRIISLSTARMRIDAAKRVLTSAGAADVRAFAVVSSADSLFLVYELGDVIQPYIEANVVLEAGTSASGRVARRALDWLSGLPSAVDLVAIVGEAA